MSAAQNSTCRWTLNVAQGAAVASGTGGATRRGAPEAVTGVAEADAARDAVAHTVTAARNARARARQLARGPAEGGTTGTRAVPAGAFAVARCGAIDDSWTQCLAVGAVVDGLALAAAGGAPKSCRIGGVTCARATSGVADTVAVAVVARPISATEDLVCRGERQRSGVRTEDLDVREAYGESGNTTLTESWVHIAPQC